MDVRELIDAAKARSGLSFGEMAQEMGVSQPRISEWRKAKYKPGASEIAYFAEKAGLPVFETVAEIEAQLQPSFSAVWQGALGKLRAAGVAATVMFTLAISCLLMTSTDTRAAGSHEAGSITSGSAKLTKPR